MLPGGSARLPYGVPAPGPHASGLRRLSVRVTDSAENRRCTGMWQERSLFPAWQVFGMIDMYTPKCNKKPKEFMQIAHQVKVD